MLSEGLNKCLELKIVREYILFMLIPNCLQPDRVWLVVLARLKLVNGNEPEENPRRFS